MQYTKGGHLPANTTVQEAEIRHNVRRLAHHPSIVLWDGCNECLDETLIFVMTIVVEEDASRSIWPSCPALGWASGVNTLTAIPNGKPLVTRNDGPSLESHGPYQHGAGFPTVNGDRGGPGPFLFPSNIPIEVHTGPTGITFANVFASEFGANVFSSFESMSPTLDATHWGIHGGSPADACTNGTDNPMHCVGKNPMSDRNYPCDNIIEVYFGKSDLSMVGERAFKKQLWQCMIAQALVIKQNIETRRSQSIFGIIVWQLNEIWPVNLLHCPLATENLLENTDGVPQPHQCFSRDGSMLPCYLLVMLTAALLMTSSDSEGPPAAGARLNTALLVGQKVSLK